jgi:hypothetical protein
MGIQKVDVHEFTELSFEKNKVSVRNDIDKLPDEVLIQIFKLLNFNERKCFPSVCRRWCKLMRTPHFNQQAQIMQSISILLPSEKSANLSLEWLSKSWAYLFRLEKEIDRWKEPKYAKEMSTKIRGNVRTELLFGSQKEGESLVARYNSLSQQEKMAVLSYIQQTCSFLERALYLIENSNDYKRDEAQQVKNFATLLDAYFRIFEGILEILPDKGERLFIRPGSVKPSINYIKNLRDGFLVIGTKTPGFNKLIFQIKEYNGDIISRDHQLNVRKSFKPHGVLTGSKYCDFPCRLMEYYQVIQYEKELLLEYLLHANHIETFKLFKSKEAINECAKLKINKINFYNNWTEIVFVHSNKYLLKIQEKLNQPNEPVNLVFILRKSNLNRLHDRLHAILLLISLSSPDLSQTRDVFDEKYPCNEPEFKFTFKLDRTFKRYKWLLETIDFWATNTEFQHTPAALISTFEKKLDKSIDWNLVDISYFSNSFYLNCWLLQKADQEKNYPLLVTIARNSLTGIAEKKIKDYQNDSDNLDKAIMAAYGGRWRATFTTKNLKTWSFIYLIKAAHEMPEAAKSAVEFLYKNSQIRATFSESLEKFKLALDEAGVKL